MEISKHEIKMENSNIRFDKKWYKAILVPIHCQIVANTLKVTLVNG